MMLYCRSSSNDEEPKIVKDKKKRTKRKIIDSDSDIKLTDVSDSNNSSSDDVKIKEDTKKSRKRTARKSSDSDSSLGEKK